MTKHWPHGGIATQIDQLRSRWPQAWVSKERNANGLRLCALPAFTLPQGWSHNICTVLWLARVTVDSDHVHGPVRGFWIDLPEVRLPDKSMPTYSRGTHDLHLGGRSEPDISGFSNWKDLTQFWWKQQMFDPNRDTLYTHAMVIRERFRCEPKFRSTGHRGYQPHDFAPITGTKP
jgi:hypothetical protein